jgi:PAS domain S-box-containing protein
MAALTLRVLKGESAGAIPEFRPDVFVTQFDWRQMNRWGIAESRLPAGSTILFREPTFWERYRTLAIATFLALALQGALIAGLLVQRARRRRSESALRESEERFRLLADTAPMLVWTSDTDKQCTFFNARWLEFTGRTLEQELGSGWTECVHPDDRDECARAYSTAFDARQLFSMEYRLRRHDGEYRWVLDTGVPRFAADGSFSGYCGSCVDVEDYRKAQAALHESAERYRLATAAGAVGVWDWNTTTRELYVDPQLKRMLGYEDVEVPNRLGAVMSLVHPADVELLLSRLQDCLEDRAQDFHLEARMVHKDGRVRWIEMQGTAVRGANGETSRIVGTGSDITERKRAEIQLKENEAVLQANHREIQMLAGRLMVAQEAERTRIARDLHDDVSQELAALSISLGKMKRSRGDAQGELSLLQLRAMTIAQNVRSLSHDLHPGILYHAGLVAALTAYCEELRGEHPVQVRCHANGDLTGVDQATKLCLYRVAQEALRNAVTHANARSVDVWLSQGSSGVELTVTDDGQGFDIKARESGKGLGLISIGERVRLAGGTLSVVTELQKGTRVHVHVPAPKPVETPAERT